MEQFITQESADLTQPFSQARDLAEFCDKLLHHAKSTSCSLLTTSALFISVFYRTECCHQEVLGASKKKERKRSKDARIKQLKAGKNVIKREIMRLINQV